MIWTSFGENFSAARKDLYGVAAQHISNSFTDP
jgi:hypothetical protein